MHMYMHTDIHVYIFTYSLIADTYSMSTCSHPTAILIIIEGRETAFNDF